MPDERDAVEGVARLLHGAALEEEVRQVAIGYEVKVLLREHLEAVLVEVYSRRSFAPPSSTAAV